MKAHQNKGQTSARCHLGKMQEQDKHTATLPWNTFPASKATSVIPVALFNKSTDCFHNLHRHWESASTCDDVCSLTILWQPLATTFLRMVRSREGAVPALPQSHTSTGHWHCHCRDGTWLVCCTGPPVMRKGLPCIVFPCSWQCLSGCTQEA